MEDWTQGEKELFIRTFFILSLLMGNLVFFVLVYYGMLFCMSHCYSFITSWNISFDGRNSNEIVICFIMNCLLLPPLSVCAATTNISTTNITTIISSTKTITAIVLLTL